MGEAAVIQALDKVNKVRFCEYTPVLAIVFTRRPVGLYEHSDIKGDDLRKDPYCRRRLLNLLPHVFTPENDSDYQILNWQPRAAMKLLSSQIEIPGV
jgi:hypothetical protein